MPIEGWDRAGQREEPSLPSLSCLAEHPLAWSLAEAPAWEGGPQDWDICPSSLSSQGATGWLLQILGAMIPGAGGDSAPSWLCPEAGVGVGGPLLSKPLPWRGSVQGQACCSTVPGGGQETVDPPWKPGITLGL